MPPVPALDTQDDEPPHCFYDASLLFRQMALNDVDRAELAANEPLLFHELQALCTLCPSKQQCVVDQASEAGGARSGAWRAYCPNAAALVALGMQQDCGLAAQHRAGHERVVLTKLGSVVVRTPRKNQAGEKAE
jgi:hypothetical protein